MHAKYADHPIAQDDKYGDRLFDKMMKEKGLNRLFLHAKSVTFTNPTTNEIQKVVTKTVNWKILSYGSIRHSQVSGWPVEKFKSGQKLLARSRA